VISLYYYPGFISLVPHIVLEELEVEYKLKFVNLHGNAHKKQDYLDLNPNGLVPVLVDDEIILYESAAICLHLLDKYQERGVGLSPDAEQRAQFFKWLMWLSVTLQPALSMYLHPYKWGSSPDTLSELRTAAEAKIGQLFDLLDATLAAKGGPWLLGEIYSPADAYALTLCRWSRGMPRPGAGWPHFGPYVRRLLQRPAVQRALQQEHLTEPWI
jgi:glutathione S-transferase